MEKDVYAATLTFNAQRCLMLLLFMSDERTVHEEEEEKAFDERECA